MAERVDEREPDGFIPHRSAEAFDPYPDLAYFRENRPGFFYEPFDHWFSGTTITPTCPEPQEQRRPDERVRLCGALLVKEETLIALETLFRRVRTTTLDEDRRPNHPDEQARLRLRGPAQRLFTG